MDEKGQAGDLPAEAGFGRSLGNAIREAVAAIELGEALKLVDRVAAGESEVRFITCAGVKAADGRLYRSVVYADLVDGGYFAECFADLPGGYSWVVFGQGETVAESLGDLRNGLIYIPATPT